MGLSLIATLFLLLVAVLPAAANEDKLSWDVVINEIHHNPELAYEAVEFVELFNRGRVAVDLSRWLLDDGIQFVFPDGATIAAGGYLVIAQDPNAFRAKYGFTPLGPFVGKLANEGELIVLRNRAAVAVDRVEYGLGFPWPVVGPSPGASMQLVNPGLDNMLAGNWRAALPSPGQRNPVWTINPPPLIYSVTHSPVRPTANQPVTITAEVTDADGLESVQLSYQIVEPGRYIALHDAAYQTQWSVLPMTAAGDGLYSVTLPSSVQRHRHLVRYRVEAVDLARQRITVPYADDPQPNFAYFVYNTLPPWIGSVGGGASGAVTYDFSQMRPMAIYHLIAKQTDVADAMFMPNSQRAAGYMGSDYPWRGTFVYDGVVYDHISFRSRGGLTRYATGKNMWKLNFNLGHRLQAYDDYGRPYHTHWDKLNLSAVIQQSHRKHRGEQGMFESLSFRLFNLAGVEAPLTHFAHLRVIDDESEVGPNQYGGDFWGLYLAIEQMDGRFLEEHNLPDGNLYKMENWTGELNNQSSAAVHDKSDLNAFLAGYTRSTPDVGWWRRNLDLERYYSYRAIIEAIRHYDLDQGKNYFYFLNPATAIWSVHPWDLDMTWNDLMAGRGEEPFVNRVLPHSELNLEYQNRLREIRDLLFLPEQINQLIDETAALINSPSHGPSMVDADRALWDNNPVYSTRYVDPDRTRPGEFYQIVPTKDFAGMLQLMRDWVVTRRRWIDQTLLTDTAQPITPGAWYVGPAGYPADSLRFQTSPFNDPQGVQTFAALEWRIGEITNPAAPGYDPAAPKIYEIDAVWQSGPQSTFDALFVPPAGVILPGHTYRVRVRMQDTTGRWSHWSAPVEFLAGAPTKPVVQDLKLSEIMYHPRSVGPVAEEDREFVELANIGRSPISLSRMQLTGGIDYTFPVGTVLEAGQIVVLAHDERAFASVYGIAPFGEYDRRLGNGGERVNLTDAYGRTIFSVAYGDGDPWPEAADGHGYSLVLAKPLDDPDRVDSWRLSTKIDGSPGVIDPVPVVINELLVQPGQGQTAAVELHNPTPWSADIGGWFLSPSGFLPKGMRIPTGTRIPANGYLVFSQPEIALYAAGESGLFLDAYGGELFLLSADGSDNLTGYSHRFEYGASQPGVAFGRLLASDGHERVAAQRAPTLGALNREPKVGPVVISQIMYHPTGGSEFIELTNISDEPVPLFEPNDLEQTWRLNGVAFQFPTGIELAPGESILIVPTAPAAACTHYNGAETVRIVGPYPLPLSDSGQFITLMMPGTRGEDGVVPYVVVDSVTYAAAAPWPTDAAGRGAALQRIDLAAYGDDPANWRAHGASDNLISAASTAPLVQLCSFDVFSSGNSTRQEIQWVTSLEQQVEKFNLWRSLDDNPKSIDLITPVGVPARGLDGGGSPYSVLDDRVEAGRRYIYWLEAVSPSQEKQQLAFTQPRHGFTRLFLPLVLN